MYRIRSLEGVYSDQKVMSLDISLVIPALNEAHKIGRDVAAATAFFKDSGMQGEVIVVDDGSSDNTAEAAAQAAVSAGGEIKVIRLPQNRGKGFAVRTGVLATQGDVVLFADSGTCVPYSDALPLIRSIQTGEIDVALASRRLKETVILRNRPWRRRLLSWLFHQAAVLLAGLPRRITDSQCGFKIFHGDAARKLFQASRTPGFLFDLEIILLAEKLGLRIVEFPVEWTCDLDTRLRPRADAPRVLQELRAVRRLGRSLKNHPGTEPAENNSRDEKGGS